MARDYKLAVFIGRFQPYHLAHHEVAKHGLSIADRLLFLVGSAHSAPTIKNPWGYPDRAAMIRSCFKDSDPVYTAPIRDYFNNDDYWMAEVQGAVSQYASEGDSIALLGNYKDASSYYLNWFPQWQHVPVRTSLQLDATSIRDAMFGPSAAHTGWRDFELESNQQWAAKLPLPVVTHLNQWYDECGEKVSYLQEEYLAVQKYKASWASAPYAPTFVTTDAVVVSAGHVLLVRRKFAPGKGLWALPGGFIKQDERIADSALRELKEETGIRVSMASLKRAVVGSHVFDHPGRSLRGRTITHAYHLRLDGIANPLPEVRGNDDAERATWMPLMDVARNEEAFFEDHAHVVTWFTRR